MLRPATPADAAELAGVQVRAWWRNYEDIVPPDWLERMTVDAREPVWREILDGPAETVVMEVAGRIAGYATYGASRDPDGDGAGELWALYVDPPAQGAGVGGQLHDAAVAALGAGGFARATLWSFAANGHARAFYERRGWTVDAAAVPPAEWTLPGVRYARRLTP